MSQDTSWGTQEIPEPLPTRPQTVQPWSPPQAGTQSCCTHGPQMALRDLAQKGLLSPETPPLATTLNPTPVQPGHHSPSLETGNPALFLEDRGPQERGSLGWRAEDEEHEDTQPQKTGTHVKTDMHTHCTDTQALPSTKGLGGRVWGQGHLPPCPGPLLIWQ